jgi:hypothetical protein
MEAVGIFWSFALHILRPFDLFYGPFGIFCVNLVYVFPYWYFVP